jgi:dihydroxyacetone kinase-like predicted kinase
MKTNVWQALITKEETKASLTNRQLQTVLKQYNYIRERMAYIESLVSEYSASAAGSPLQRSSYQLQLYRMREQLGTEAESLAFKIREAQKSLAGHHGEIQKFDKIRLLNEERLHEQAQRTENLGIEELCTLQLNFQRRR